MIDEDIINKFSNKKQIKWFIFDKLWPDEYNYLINRFSDSESIQESYYRILNKEYIKPKCPICGNPCKLDIRKNRIFSITCGNKQCKDKIWHIKLKENCIEKYGCENIFQLESVKEKIKQTNLNKYGVPYSFQNKTIQEKYKKTMKEKYGYTNSLQAPDIKKKYDFNKMKEKEYLTKKKLGTYNSSKMEDKSYKLIKEKYPDVIRQYRSEVYPFNCDFYIPSLDLYVECQYGQFHNDRPYLGTEQDLKEIEILKEKAHKIHIKTGKDQSRYDMVIDTWVNRDVKKRNIVKQNKLNYLEIWNLNQLYDWISNNG